MDEDDITIENGKEAIAALVSKIAPGHVKIVGWQQKSLSGRWPFTLCMRIHRREVKVDFAQEDLEDVAAAAPAFRHVEEVVGRLSIHWDHRALCDANAVLEMHVEDLAVDFLRQIIHYGPILRAAGQELTTFEFGPISTPNVPEVGERFEQAFQMLLDLGFVKPAGGAEFRPTAQARAFLREYDEGRTLFPPSSFPLAAEPNLAVSLKNVVSGLPALENQSGAIQPKQEEAPGDGFNSNDFSSLPPDEKLNRILALEVPRLASYLIIAAARGKSDSISALRTGAGMHYRFGDFQALIRHNPRSEARLDDAVRLLMEEDFIDASQDPSVQLRKIRTRGFDFADRFSNLGPSSRPEEFPTLEGTQMMPSPPRNERLVWVVHGRNSRLRADLFAFLRALGLDPQEFSRAIKATGKGSPTIPEILDENIPKATAIVVLLTGDDLAQLRSDLLQSQDGPDERTPTPQPRANVIYETGMAFATNPTNTILVQVGRIRAFSNLSGRHVIHLNNSAETRKELADRLQTAGLPVDTIGKDWISIGDFVDTLPVTPTAGTSD